ncbi:MAG: cation transporter [Bacteroidia bacterium]|nr:cation transporter [Bacteroidia bacterium]
MALTELNLKITGMTCGHCERSVANEIKALDGIASVQVNHNSGTGIVVFNDAMVSVSQIIAAVEETGIYHAEALQQ